MLKQNNLRIANGSYKFSGVGTINGFNTTVAFSAANFQQIGAKRNIFAGQGGISKLSAQPAGARPPVAWQMAQVNGGMASRNNTVVSLTPVGLAAMGLPTSGSATVTITVPDATGQMNAIMSGTTTVSISASGLILSVASISGVATIDITTNNPIISAIGYASGASIVAVTHSANMTAVGHLSGTSTNENEFSPDALSNAVWGAVIESGYTAAEILRIITAVSAGSADGLDGVAVFKSIDGTKNRVQSTIFGNTRTTTDLDPDV